MFNEAWAIESNLVLHTKTGEKIRVTLDEEPIIKFKDSKLLISSSLIDLEFEQGRIIKATYELPQSSISSITNDTIGFSYHNNIVTITNINEHTPYFLYSIDGRLLYEGRSVSNTISFSMDPYQSGAYIFKAGINSYKLIKK